MAVALKVEGLGKKYLIKHQNQEQYTALRDVITNTSKKIITSLNPFGKNIVENDKNIEEFWAVKDINFEVEQGDRVGIIGRNGAGKSTLLKLLSRITEPSTGKIGFNGKIASLLEVGTGFHPELTGRENIYLNGAILGMSKSDIRRQFDEIVAFAEVEKFLDTPVKRYSSGMYVRLAFAVAAHINTEILIVDEVLAVGDAKFQKKSLEKMNAISKEGRTLLFVSHNMGAVSELCNKGIMLDKGQVIYQGSMQETVNKYLQFNQETKKSKIILENTKNTKAYIKEILICNEMKEVCGTFDLVDNIYIYVKYELLEKLSDLVVAIIAKRNARDVFYTFDIDHQETCILEKDIGEYELELKIPKRFLKAGTISLTINLGLPSELIQSIDSGIEFEIEERTVNSFNSGFKIERPGDVIFPGIGITKRLSR